MLVQKYKPTLADLLKVNSLPENLGFLQGPLSSFLDKLFYENLQAFKSANGDSASYTLDIITYKKLVLLEIPGTGVAFVVNPPSIIGVQSSSVFNVSFEYSWEILKYIRGANLQTFSFDIGAYLTLLGSIFGISKQDFLEETINVFIGDIGNPAPGQDPLQDFVTDYNGSHTNQLIYTSGDTFSDIYTQLQSFGEDIFALIKDNYLDNAFDRLRQLIAKWVGPLDEDRLKDLLLPKFSASLNNISFGIEFPRNIFTPLDPLTGLDIPEPARSMVIVNAGAFKYDTKDGFTFNKNLTFDFPKSRILGTQFTLEIDDLKIDLSKTKNIPEATADGRPNDFVGVYVKKAVIGFPLDWNHDTSPASTGEVIGTNLLIGTGGISGTIGMQAKTGVTTAPIIKAKFGSGFEIELDAFFITFQQNAIIDSEIKGAMMIPGFKDASGNPAKIFIDIHIGQNGEFSVVASVAKAVPLLTIPNVFAFDIKSLFIGKNADGRFYVGCSGDIDFLLQNPIGKFLPDKVDINKLIIYDDGKFEIEGGSIYLPKAFELKLGPAKIAITAIHLGSFEKEDRKYKYFGFDGGVNVSPGGVDARGKGIKYYYTVDGPFNSSHEFKWFIRLESLAIDIIIPGSAKPADAAVIIKGFLSIKDPKIAPGTVDPLLTILKNSTEYAGGVYVSIPKFKGLEASASMRLNPKVPAFIVDLGIEISTPILLGTTGLGIYGFRALFGKKYVASKTAADLAEDAEWWQYYKAKIDPDYKEGIQTSKFLIKEGFSFGAGVSLATSSDSGKTFSSKLFFLLSLPDVFLFQGQAQFLKDRIKLDAVPDPPFFAIIAITKHSVEAGFGINYKIPEDTGKLVTVDGVTELGFFFGDASAFYFNIGRESPDSMRIQARVFDILNMYFYFMISNSGIRAGAGVSFGLKKTFGPLSAELKAYLDSKGRISFRPKQIGGAIQMGGTVSLKCCGFGFSVSGGATLAAEAPKPHIITGEFEVCVKVLKKERCAHFQFTWNFDSSLNPSRNPVLVDVTEGSPTSNLNDLNKVAKSSHMVTGETLNLATDILSDGTSSASPPIRRPELWIDVNPGVDNYIVPVDTFIDIEFKKGLNVSPTAMTGSNLDKIGGMSSPCEYVEFVPPQRGNSDRVRHEYFFEKIEIKYWDETAGGSWKDYNFYDALLPMFPGTQQVGSLIDPAVLANMKWGYWQQQRPGYNNKLRILATTPLSYAASTGSLPIENLGINGNTLLCPGNEVPKTCITFDSDQVYKNYPANVLNMYKGLTIKITTQDGTVLTFPYLGVANGLLIQPGNVVELFFNEPMRYVNLLINSGAPGINIRYYERMTVLDASGHEILSGGLPTFTYDQIKSKNHTAADWAAEIPYQHATRNIDYVKITTTSCYETPDQPRKIVCLRPDDKTLIRLREMNNFILTLLKNKHFTAPFVELNPAFGGTYTGVYMGTSLYPTKNFRENKITLTQGYMSGTTLLFTIADNTGFSCNYSFELLKPFSGFSFANITEIISITPYTTDATAGINYSFLIRAKVNINGVSQEVEIIGKSCLPMAYCYDTCSTGLYRVCYLSYANFLLNQTIPTPAQQNANNQTMLNSINKTLQPIWRPNTTFAIRVRTSDKLYREGGSSALTSPYYLDMVYGFKTAGPIGHYHNYPVNNTTKQQQERKDYEKLELADKADDFKLSSLKFYIDYTKCYPNADGDIINAKPLFYKNAELRLFYLYNYVYEFYNDWVDVSGTSGQPYIAKSSLDVVIRDPEDSTIPEVNPSLSFVGGSIPHIGAPGSPPVNINNINNDVNTLNNILLNGNPCASYTPLAPIDISSKKTIDLKPLKLYTAQFIARYNPLIAGQYASVDYTSVAHTYAFQTSRYKNFTEQVNSYILKQDEFGFILKAAVFPIEAVKVNSVIDLSLAANVITNNEPFIPGSIKLQYADQFDRLINGVLHIDYNQLHSAVTTEFNIIKHPDTGNIIGILIRNPEPFNDPKLPKSDPSTSSSGPNETLEVSVWNGYSWNNAFDNYVIHSKDRSKMFVTGRDFSFNMDPLSILKFTFRYKLYNGVSYADVTVVDVEIDLNSYSI
jgi:hypothetical protein